MTLSSMGMSIPLAATSVTNSMCVFLLANFAMLIFLAAGSRALKMNVQLMLHASRIFGVKGEKMTKTMKMIKHRPITGEKLCGEELDHI